MLRERKCDLVLSDLAMKPMDGLEFTRQCAIDEHSPNPFRAHHHDHRPYRKTPGGSGARCRASPNSWPSRSPPTILFSRIAEIVERPRAFVRCDTYFGPDRRRQQLEDYAGPWRRQDDFAGCGGALMTDAPKTAQIIPPDAYPQMVSKSDAAARCRARCARRRPRSAGAQVIEEARRRPCATAVRDYVERTGRRPSGDIGSDFGKGP